MIVDSISGAPMTAIEIARLIKGSVFRFANEIALQDGIEALLKGKGIEYGREVSLSARDRVDFMHGDIGIEVKIDSPTNSVQRQLWRYAQSDKVKSLILVTSRAKHKQIPDMLLDKPVIVVHLLASIF
jgi:hypothetical protein